MKFSKIFSAAAALAAAGMMTVSASANLVVPSNTPAGADYGTGQVVIQVFNVGNEAENKPATDYGIDLTKVAKLSATITLDTSVEEDMLFYTGAIGGSLVLSINGGDITSDKKELWDKYNWPGKNWWGMVDPDLGIETLGADNVSTVETVSKGVYKITTPVCDNPLANGDASEIGCMQIAFQMWGDDANFSTFTLNELQVLDASDNVLLTFDASGNGTVGGGSSTPAPAPSTDNNNASTPANNVDTGVEGVAAVVGVAALAAGAVVLSRKRK